MVKGLMYESKGFADLNEAEQIEINGGGIIIPIIAGVVIGVVVWAAAEGVNEISVRTTGKSIYDHGVEAIGKAIDTVSGWLN